MHIFQKSLNTSSVIKGLVLFCYGIFFTYISVFFGMPKDFKGFEVIFFDIGQGDSALIRLPGSGRILIDGGPDLTILYKLGAYIAWGEREFDTVFVSHPHADHITGLIEFLERYRVREIVLPDVSLETPEYRVFMEKARERGVTVTRIVKKEVREYGYDAKIEILHPEKIPRPFQEKDINNSSLLLRLVYKDAAFLFTGDLEAAGQKENMEETLRSNVLKVPHQGSSDSLLKDFLEKVQPEISVISVGKNTYGHPSLRVIRTLERMGSKVFITQKDGDIHIRFGNQGIFVHK